MSFRKKIFFSQLILVIVLILFLFQYVQVITQRSARLALITDERGMIKELQKQQNDAELVDYLKTQEVYLYLSVKLLNDKKEPIYDINFNLDPEHAANYTQVNTLFDFHGKQYTLEMAAPLQHRTAFARQLEWLFLIFTSVILLFFSSTTWLLFYRLSRPIQTIIDVLRPYQTGEVAVIPEIHLPPTVREEDDFARLAKTLNLMSDRIRAQMKSAFAERNEREAILESLSEGVIAIDAERKVKYVNSVGSKMLQVPKKQLLGNFFPTITPLQEKCRLLLRTCLENRQAVTDSISLGEGGKLYLDLIAAPIADEKEAIIVLQDKSSQHRVLEMGKDFVANASHELRTPITIIKGFAETLQDLQEMSPEMLSDITEKIVRNCERMEMLVKNLLLLADIENIPKARFQECDVVSLIENCVNVLKTVYPDAHIKIHKDQQEVLIPAEPDLFELAIKNLLDNAAKYSLPPAEINITIQVLNQEVKIEIKDNGIGIP
ncbi:MAG TPA: histidine kinase dimerization/phospho-acceptor domain-containing protein, partial [Rhabdochlamydiaceae bacterium]